MNDAELRRRYPHLPWDEPLEVVLIGNKSVFVCRYCVAKYGLKWVNRKPVSIAGEELVHGLHQEIINHIEGEHVSAR